MRRISKIYKLRGLLCLSDGWLKQEPPFKSQADGSWVQKSDVKWVVFLSLATLFVHLVTPNHTGRMYLWRVFVSYLANKIVMHMSLMMIDLDICFINTIKKGLENTIHALLIRTLGYVPLPCRTQERILTLLRRPLSHLKGMITPPQKG